MIEQHGSIAEKFIKKGFWLYILSFIIGPLSYSIKIIVSSHLSVSDVGILYGVMSLIILVSAYNDLGLTDSLNYFIPKFITEKRYDKIKSILVYTFLAQILTWVSIASVFFFGADYIWNHYFENPDAASILKVFAFYFSGINIFQVLSTFFMAVQNTFYNKVTEIVRLVLNLSFIGGCIFFETSTLLYFSYSWLFWLYIWLIFSFFVFIKKYYIPYLSGVKMIWSKTLFQQFFYYALTVFLSIQALTILGQLDMQFIIYFLGTQDAGYYSTYLSIIGIPFMIIGPIFWLFYPIFSEMSSKGEFEKIKMVKAIFQKNFLAITLANNILFFVFAHTLAYIFFWEKFLKSWEILQYSILFLSFNFLLQMNFNILASIGKVRERIYIVCIAIFCNAINNYIFINLYGVDWAALASGIGWIIIWLLSEYYLGKKYYVPLAWNYILKNIAFMLPLWIFLFYYIVPYFEGFGRILSLLFFCIVASIYFALFTFFNRKDFLYFMGEIQRVRKNIS